jgi:hypothetical protein
MQISMLAPKPEICPEGSLWARFDFNTVAEKPVRSPENAQNGP